MTLMTALPAQAQGAASSTLPAFTCDGFPYQVINGQLKRFDTTTFQFTDVGIDHGETNGHAYNVVDNYVYGVDTSSAIDTLIRLGIDGNIESIADVPPGRPNSGAMDNSGFLYTYRDLEIYKTDVEASATNPVDSDNNGLPDVVSTTISLSFTSNLSGLADIAWFEEGGEEFLIAVKGNKVFLINLSTGVVTANIATVSNTADTLTGAFGAIWYSGGRILVFQNDTGNIYEIFNATSATPDLRFLVKSDPAGSNDGFNCATAPFPNIPPVAQDDKLTVPAAITSTLDLAVDNGNGPDADPEGGLLTVASITAAPGNGVATINAGTSTVDYTPNLGFTGFDYFSYEIQDVAGDTSPADVTIIVGDFDMGDAPDTYGQAIHGDDSAAYFLGTDLTYDQVILNSANADADVDNGVTLPSQFDRTEIETITVTVAGSGGYLQGFIDWDGNGDFLGTGEQVATDVQDGGVGDNDGTAGTITLNVTVPVTAQLGTSFARFRYASASSVNAQDITSDGEAEDYMITIAASYSIDLDKVLGSNDDEDSSGDVTLGDTLNYTITATNTGTDTLTNVVVSDDKISPSSESCASVAIGGTCVLTGTYTVTQADVDAGSILNTASAQSTEVTTAVTDDETTSVVQTSSLSIDKPAPANADNDSSGDITLDDVLTYTITATNDGTVTQTNVVVSDDKISPSSQTCASVAPGATCVLTGTYTVTQADVDTGSILNTASAQSTEVTTAVTDDETTSVVQTSSLSIDKPAPANADNDSSGDITLDDVLTYTITATNDGTVTQTNVVVSDDKISPSSQTCASVAPGATCVLTGTYTVTQADVDTGSILNTASAQSTEVTTAVTDDETTSVVQTSSLSIDKPAPANADNDSSGDITLDDVLTYTITATNDGTVTQTNVVVSDDKISPSSQTCASVAPGATCVLTGTYTVTQADVNAGSILNTASAQSTEVTTAVTDDETTSVVQTSSLSIDKPAPANADNDSSGDITLDDVLTYTITATNDGTVTQTNVVVSDDKISPSSQTCASVAPGATCVLTGTYTVTQADVNAGSILNTASAQSTEVTTAVTDDETTSVVQTSSLSIDKPAPANADNDSSGDITLDDVLTYTITATNDGTVTQTNVVVSDDKISPSSQTCASVAPGATCVLTGTYTVTQADVNAGSILNTASAQSTEVTTAVTDDETTSVAQTSSLSIDKPAPANADNDSSGDITLDDVLTYTITATNDGTVTQTNVVVSDDKISPSSQTCASVAPGATCVLTGTYTVTQADVNAGSILNTASAQSTEVTTAVTDDQTVTVISAEIDAVLESGLSVNGRDGGSINILASDTLNGSIVSVADVTISENSSDPELSLDTTTGIVTIGAATLAGVYTVEYEICEVVNPSNCDTVTETVTVDAASFDDTPTPDPLDPVNGTDGGVAGNVLDNHTLNGEAIDVADVTITVGAGTDSALTLDPATGSVSIAPGTPAGVYTVEYEICENLNPSNCTTETQTVTVDAASFDDTPTPDPLDPVNGTDGGVAGNVLDNHTLNGEAIDVADVTITVGAGTDSELTLDPATGSVSIAPGTPAGVYTVEYEICENLNPSNCTTETQTVTVDAASFDDTPTPDPLDPVNGTDGGVAGNVLDNHTLNGEAIDVADVTITVGAGTDSALTLDPATGSVSIAPGTPAGVYTVEYEICENLNPSNCTTETQTVTVDAASFDDTPTPDPLDPVNGTDGGVAGNVLDNHTLNGEAIDVADVTITVGAGTDSALTLDPATGSVSIAPGTPAGVYTVEYEICENLNPSNCTTETQTVTVDAASFDDTPTPDPLDPVNGTDGGVAGNVLDNHTLNGEAIDVADVTITVGAGTDSELTLDPATGSVSIAPGTPAGVYTVEYEICENLNPSNCTTETQTVTVDAASFDDTPTPDPLDPVNGTDGGVAGNVLDNHTLNGEAIDVADVTITVGAGTDSALTLDPATGSVSIAPGTPAGVYTVEYEICENLNPSNCTTETQTVTVDAASFDDTPTPDPLDPVNGTDGGVAGNVLDNHTLNGEAIDVADVTITVGAGTDSALTLDPATGSVSIAPGTPAGVYTVEYEICENLNPSNCTTETQTVTVDAASFDDTPTPDPLDPVNGTDGGVAGNVLDNHTLNGEAIDVADVTITVGAGTDSALTLDPATGSVSIAPGTPAGVYTVEYEICENLNPSNCTTETQTVTVDAASFDDTPTPDPLDPVNGTDGGVAGNVLDNHTLNGEAIDVADVTITVGAGTDSALTLDPATGSVSIAPGTPAGVYTVEYEICENLNPSNCTTETQTVTVDAASFDDTPTPDPLDPVNGTDGGVAGNVLDNHTLNGEAIDVADVTITVGAGTDSALTLDPATGSVSIAPGTPAGVYTVEYEICENLNPSNCTTETQTVTVDAASFDDTPTPDPLDPVNGTDGGVAGNVLDNHTLNGEAIDVADVTITVGAGTDSELTLDPATGSVSIAPGTPAGVYTVEYEICENLNPSNCTTETQTVTVDAASFDDTPTPDPLDPVNGTDGGVAGNVLDNHTLNGEAIDVADVTITVGAGTDSALTLDPATGSVSIAPGTPAGVYTVEYEICENLNPSNCTTETQTVTVDAASFDDTPTPDPLDPVNGTDGGVAGNVLDNHTLNGEAIDVADVTITVGAGTDSALTLDPATGSVSIAPGTPAGVYTVEYEICENLNPSNCTTETQTVTVDAASFDDTPTPDPLDPVNGTDGGVAGNVLDNHTLNGEAIDVADVTITVGAGTDSALTLDPATGSVSIAPGTPAGVYTVEYEICENLNPSNCTTETQTVTVDAASFDDTPTPDPLDPVNGTDGGVAGNVLDNHTLNGEAIDVADVTITVGAGTDSALTLDPATGSVSIAPGTPAGVYTVEYEICENLNPSNCTTGTQTVTVDAAPLEITAEGSVDEISSSGGGENVANVLDNIMLNAEQATTDIVSVGVAPGTTLPEGITLNPDGSIDVAPNTEAGEYIVEFEVCEILNPDNCATSRMTVGVVIDSVLLTGIVYFDVNGNDDVDDGETRLGEWIVRVYDNGTDSGLNKSSSNFKQNIVHETLTDESGYYEITLLFGNYVVEFVNPENDTVYHQTAVAVDINSKQPNGEFVAIANLPVDPSGVIYDAVSRQPVSGVEVSFVNGDGVELPTACFLDPTQQNQVTDSMGMYRFDLFPGAVAACPLSEADYRIVIDAPDSYSDTASTVIGVEPGFLTPPAGMGAYEVVPHMEAPQTGEDTTYYLGFRLGNGSRSVINNHIPLDSATLIRTDMVVMKRTPRRDVSVGDVVPYEIKVSNTEDLPRVDLDMIDYLPKGLRYVEDTFRINGEAVTPLVNGREIRVDDLDVAGNETITISLMASVGAGVSEGVYTNQAYVEDPLGAEVSNRGEASVRVVADPLFDCSEVIGKVFDDRNGNGVQDQGEDGLAGVRLATVKGLLVSTDANGRYHIACAAVPHGKIGSNFVLKIDEGTLPSGYVMRSENPRVVRLTRGKMSKINFGASIENVITLDISDAAFVAGSYDLKPAYEAELPGLVDRLNSGGGVLRLNYYTSDGDVDVEGRLDQLAKQIRRAWKRHGGKGHLVIEKKSIKPAIPMMRQASQ